MAWSADGNWFWDGARWNEAVSEDGQWRFDGTDWKPFAGQRSTMPSPAAPPAPVPEPSPTVVASPAKSEETAAVQGEQVEKAKPHKKRRIRRRRKHADDE